MCHCFFNSVNPPKTRTAFFAAKQIGMHQHCFGTFSEISETPYENLELSWEGWKVFRKFRKSTDINLIPNLKK